MGFITLENTPITLNPNQLATSQGWIISNGTAFHEGCFAGNIILRNIEVQPGKTYSLTYRVSYYISGGVYAIVGGVNGIVRTALGYYTQQFYVPEDATDLTIQFWSDGTLGINYMNTYPVLDNPNNGVTIGFNSENNRWTSNYSFKPEMMLKFINDLFTFKNARLYKHNKNEVRNYFYDTQYGSEIQIVVNINPTEVKNFYTIRLKSNKPWSATEITTPVREGKSRGQLSRIKKGNFRSLQGDWFAAFLRDLNTPNIIDAITKGAELQGNYMEITLVNEDTAAVKMLSIDIEVSKQDYTY